MKKRMGLFGGLILVLCVSSAQASNEDDAKKAFLDATSKQLGIDAALNNWVKQNIPKKYVKLAEQMAPVVQAATTGTLTLTWEIK